MATDLTEVTEVTKQGTVPQEPRWTFKGPDETTELVVGIRPGAPLHVEAHGELDIVTTPWLREELLCLILWHGPRLVLDLSRVTFMDCAGIGALLAMRRRAQLAGGWMRVVNPSRPVSRIIATTGLRLVLAPDPLDAVGTVDGGRRARPADDHWRLGAPLRRRRRATGPARAGE
jgi:anti-anti-sigma factor